MQRGTPAVTPRRRRREAVEGRSSGSSLCGVRATRYHKDVQFEVACGNRLSPPAGEMSNGAPFEVGMKSTAAVMCFARRTPGGMKPRMFSPASRCRRRLVLFAVYNARRTMALQYRLQRKSFSDMK